MCTPLPVLVVRNSGPRGYPGMAEVGNLPLPQKILASGVTDMVRVSDAQMSGTSYGTVVMHVSPEAAVGGPLAAVRTGDVVILDVANRTLDIDIDVDADEIASRLRGWGATAGGRRREMVDTALRRARDGGQRGR